MRKSLLILLIMTVILALTLGSCKKPDTDTEQTPGQNTENGVNTEDNTDSGKNEDNTPEHTHEYINWTEISAPDCENEGTERGQCPCGETSERAIAALGHTSGDWIVESVPTETSDGYKYKSCTRCGEKTEEKVIEYVENSGILYEVNDDGTSCTIIEVGIFEGDDLKIPEYIEGYRVTSIGKEAFNICYSLTSIVIPDSVTSIADGAFYICTSLASITVDANNPTYKSIDENLYTKDGKILIRYALGKADDSFVIPEGVTCIENYAFSSCSSLTSIVIPEGVTSIGDYAFQYCSSLTSIVIPEGVTSIGDYAFDGCIALESVVIPDSVTSIGKEAFNYCSSLTSITVNANNPNYKSIDGNLYTKDGKTLIRYAVGKADDSFVIPEGVTSIGNWAFYNCRYLTSVVMPEGVTYIGDYAFEGCDALTSVVIPDSVTSIGDYAFYSCESLISIVIPEGATSVGEGALAHCTALTSVVIPEGVTYIEEWTFYYCSSLTSIVIPESVTSIGNYAFEGCSSLTDVYYTGSAAEWAEISIDDGNEYLTSATKHYNYVPAE